MRFEFLDAGEGGRELGVGGYCIYLYGKSGVALVLVVGGIGGVLGI